MRGELALLFLCLAWHTSNAAVFNLRLSGVDNDGLSSSNLCVLGESTCTAATGGVVASSFDNETNAFSVTLSWGSNNGFQDLSSQVSFSFLQLQFGLTARQATDWRIGGDSDPELPSVPESPLSFSYSTSSSIASGVIAPQAPNQGSVVIALNFSPAQAHALLTGKLFVVIATTLQPSGEMRANFLRDDAVITRFKLMGVGGPGLQGSNEQPIPVMGGGSGDVDPRVGIIYDSVTDNLAYGLKWGSANGHTDLTGDVVASHLHGPTPDASPLSFSQVGGAKFALQTRPGFNVSGVSGGVVSQWSSLGSTAVAELMSGRLYFNIHTPLK